MNIGRFHLTFTPLNMTISIVLYLPPHVYGSFCPLERNASAYLHNITKTPSMNAQKYISIRGVFYYIISIKVDNCASIKVHGSAIVELGCIISI